MSKHPKSFRSAEEMGRYFDGHEVTEENSRATTAIVDKRYDPTLAMRIPEEDLKKLKELADERGVPTATMGRMLLLERLRGEGAPRDAALRLLETIGADEGLRDTLRTVIRAGRPKASSRSGLKHPSQRTPRKTAKAL
jgi:predicted DNA binding CopG/RHH family protein